MHRAPERGPLRTLADLPASFRLLTRDHRLLLRDDRAGEELVVDFASGDLLRRLRTRSIKDQPLARAVGLPGTRPHVLDCTAGLLGDALLLVGLGCRVTALERSPVLLELLRDGLRRALAAPQVAPLLRGALELVPGDAREFLRGSGSRAFDVIYLDPMYPESSKDALPRKEIRFLRELVGSDADAGELLELALAARPARVVVKRPLHAPLLRPGRTHAFPGKLQRFDLYLPVAGA